MVKHSLTAAGFNAQVARALRALADDIEKRSSVSTFTLVPHFDIRSPQLPQMEIRVVMDLRDRAYRKLLRIFA